LSRRPSARRCSSTSGSACAAARRERRAALEVDLDVEVARVGQHGAVLHALEVLRREHAARAR
jgi:hypothetical protein